MIKELPISPLSTVKQHTTLSIEQIYSTCTPVQSRSHRRCPKKQDLRFFQKFTRWIWLRLQSSYLLLGFVWHKRFCKHLCDFPDFQSYLIVTVHALLCRLYHLWSVLLHFRIQCVHQSNLSVLYLTLHCLQSLLDFALGSLVCFLPLGSDWNEWRTYLFQHVGKCDCSCLWVLLAICLLTI